MFRCKGTRGTKRSIVLVASCALLLGAASAQAAGFGGMKDPPSSWDWTAINVGIGGGAGAINHEVSITPGPLVAPLVPGLSVSTDGVGGEGGFFTLSVGGDYQVGPKFVIGAFFDYDFSGIETELFRLSVPTVAGIATGISAGADIDVDDHWYLGGRIGYLATPRTLWYASFGYTELSLDDTVLRFSANPAVIPPAITALINGFRLSTGDYSGWFVGAGVETIIHKNWSLKGEYRYAEYDSERVNLPTVAGINLNTVVNIDIEPSTHMGRLTLNYKFGGRHYQEDTYK